MAAALRAIGLLRPQTAASRWPALLAAGLVLVPLAGAVGLAALAGLDPAGWTALGNDPQWARALAMTAWTGLLSTALSVLISAWLLSRIFPGPAWARLTRWLAPMLAVPHAAFAIGLAFLVAPSGWLLRLLSPWATGFDAPPGWRTTQDPWGLGLMAVLVFKEVPFLLWAAATQLQRADVGQRWTREHAMARSMGYSAAQAWWQVIWPQLWPRLSAPLVAVLAYSLTVVDMALVMGPMSPPTLSVLAWQWLQDGDPVMNAQGVAAGWMLAGSVGLVALGAWALARMARARPWPPSGRRAAPDPLHRCTRSWAWHGLVAVYAAVMLALALGSVSGVWPFPQVWPDSWTLQAWQSVLGSSRTLWTTLWLAVASSLTALLWSVLWLEWSRPAWDGWMRRLVVLPLVLPSVVWVAGVHRLCLGWQIDGYAVGLWLAHTLAALPYVLIALSPAYLGFDPRYGQLSASMGKSHWQFLIQVKWPLLKAALTAALAVGFAVSVAQFLPTLFVGAGRFSTVTTEAVTLASGAQRSLTAAYAWLQWLLPAVGFAGAAWAGRPRRFRGVPT